MNKRQLKREAQKRLKRKIILICCLTVVVICGIMMYLVTMDMHNVSQDFMTQKIDSSTHDNNSKLNFAKSYAVQKEKQGSTDRDEEKKDKDKVPTGSTDNGKSGILFGDYPGEIFAISMTGEGSGGASGLMGDKGRAYGLMQLDYRYALMDFIEWVVTAYPNEWGGLSKFVGTPKSSGTLVNNNELLAVFEDVKDNNTNVFMSAQCEFFYENYFKSPYNALKEKGIDLDERHVAVSAAIMSLSVNCGSQGSKYANVLDASMTDEEMIRTLYARRRDGTLKSNGTGDARWKSENEEQQAIDMLNGDWTIDSNYERADKWSGGWHWDRLYPTYFE